MSGRLVYRTLSCSDMMVVRLLEPLLSSSSLLYVCSVLHRLQADILCISPVGKDGPVYIWLMECDRLRKLLMIGLTPLRLHIVKDVHLPTAMYEVQDMTFVEMDAYSKQFQPAVVAYSPLMVLGRKRYIYIGPQEKIRP